MAPKHSLLSDDDYDPGSEPPVGKKKKSAPKMTQLRQKAEVFSLAADPNMAEQNSASKPAVEERILERIRKCLTKANHPGTPETEAKTAFRMGLLLMGQHNITQAQVFEKDKENDKVRLGGESVVKIISANNNDRKVLNLAFASPLATAMRIFFDCKCYSINQQASIGWTFYGIATNTAAAAMSFEMAFNLILHWASSKKGISTRHSYCLGVANGLITIAEIEKAEERKKSKESEMSEKSAAEESAQAQRAREIDRLNFQVRTPKCSFRANLIQNQDPEEDVKHDVSDSILDFSDDEDNDALEDINPEILKLEDEDINPEIFKLEDEDEKPFVAGTDFEDGPDKPDFLGDFENELKKNYARETTPPIKTWESEMQLTLFRAKAGEIADEYLQKKNVKLHKSKPSTAAKDYAAYQQGKKDSRKVDVRRKRLEAS